MTADSTVVASSTSIMIGALIVTVDMKASAGNLLCPIAWLYAAPPNLEGPFFLLSLQRLREPKRG
jgi:hypothetical protein